MKKTLMSFALVLGISFFSFTSKAANKSYNAGTVGSGSSICLPLSSGEQIIGTSITFQREGSCVRVVDADKSSGRTVAIGEVVTNYNRYTVYAIVR